MMVTGWGLSQSLWMCVGGPQWAAVALEMKKKGLLS